MWLDESLNWRKHIACVISKVFRALSSLAYLRRSLDVKTRSVLVRALCSVHLDYCSAVYSSLNVRISTPLTVSLNACIRFITNIPKFHSVSPFRHNLGFLTTKSRRLFFALVIFFQLINYHFPRLLYNTVLPIPHSRHRVSRSANQTKFILPLARSHWKTQSFSYAVVSAPNNLPETVRTSSSVSAFKRSLRAYLVTGDV